ncbi:adenosylmethionine decarboxylase [Pseudomonadales bacterium]|nr:adenosylmethionine decarboxylase [Pseudomonadales bacterium]MDA9064400.1 adenosylmethionine decarboxylase [Pseudomonadales bacterium]MDA9366287.1 adenosylmethionine decarboxylase [Pseudomonadales bacterium]MDB4068922.1 adenosylmethionine decarboxylase [Pseudomonadales bacterium]MDB4150233.1 adenosylmethionine decarboxylase [Pseudomonadales bacterium]
MNQPSANSSPDALMTRDGASFAGLHVTVDLFEAIELDNINFIETVMRECVVECGATLLHIHLDHFTPNDGVTGVAVLAESHISVHTWPERGFAAFDLFMCGEAQPEKAIDILEARFCAKRTAVNVFRRGLNL